MKKFSLGIFVLFFLSITWMGFVREPLPPSPEICTALSEEVRFNFNINAMDYSNIELNMKEKIAGKSTYIQFKMANAWKTGRVGLVLKGMKTTGDINMKMSPQSYLNDKRRKEKKGKDFSIFLKDKGGKSVSSYSFKQTLVEGKSGQKFMKMSYSGPPVEMLQTLEIPHPITLPSHLSRKFTPKGIIQFKPGTVALDRKIKGFFIPVVIR